MTLGTSIGQIAVIQGDFGSPRFRSKWNHAHKMVDEFGNELLGHIKQRELPVVLVGDLNSTPSGSISRRLSELGLFRAKPKHYFVGTYPDWPWPFSVAIDDVMTSGELSIVRWRAENATGSDHRPISVEIVRVR
ncbi:MAG: endonuclease/exonuclease/phosphatase family protein [Planctomycetota bacterium]